MGHFVVVVLTPHTADHKERMRRVETLLAPYSRTVEVPEHDAEWWSGEPDEPPEPCAGARIYKTTFNPRSKWAWYDFGSRWDGWIAGAGVQNEGAASDRDRQPVRLIELNTVPASSYLERLKGNAGEFTPSALVTPDGEWHESGARGDWSKRLIGLVAAHADCDAVTVDCQV